ncbi:MAG: hypothetical protein IJ748_06755, partial [Bacteroidales bacterium]|nr:hypothetical protein [Bacteroidales bacterium]
MRLKNKKDNHNSHKAGLSAQRFAPGVLLFVFFASVLSFSAAGQDTTFIMGAFYGELINDSVVKLWMPEVSDGYKGYFERRRSSEGNIWQIISSEETRRFTEPYYDTFYYSCKDTLTYRYILTTLHDGGISKSREQQFTVGDVEIPDMPENSVFSVNVNTNQNLSFSFSPSQSDDVMGYVICKGNPCVALDTLWGKENTDYSCLSCSSEEINELAVMSFDSCMNTSLRSNKLNNIVLRAKRENCSGIVKLSWNEYKYMPSGLNNYEIHLINADGESIIQSTPYLNSSLDITPYGNEIEMYVRAVGNSDIFFANSNKITLNQMTADTLDYIRMK